MVTVMPYEKVLHYRHGALVRVLGPGVHRWPSSRGELIPVDLRTQLLEIRPQEVSTADGIRLKVSAAMAWKVSDPVMWHETTEQPTDFLYDTAKSVIRDLVRQVASTDALDLQVTSVPDELSAVAARVGADVESFAIRDIILPADIRRAAENVAAARYAAATDLERTRSEVASLRALANVGGVLEQHPALVGLRMAQQAAESGGTVIVERPANDHTRS